MRLWCPARFAHLFLPLFEPRIGSHFAASLAEMVQVSRVWILAQPGQGQGVQAVSVFRGARRRGFAAQVG